MIWDLLLVAAGLAVLFVAGDQVVAFAAAVAERLGVSPAVIGLTVVAAGTSMPEFFVSLFSVLKERPELAASNVVGSNIANVTLILGLTAAVRSMGASVSVMRLDYPFMLLASWVSLLLARDLLVDRLEGAFLVGALLAFLSYLVASLRGAPKKELKPLGEMVPPVAERLSHHGPLFLLTGLVLAFAGLSLGSHLLVIGASYIAAALGVSDRVIGLTIVAVGTSLPELVASLAAALKNHHEMAVANLVGSNIFNLLLILGLCAAVRPIPLRPVLLVDFWVMLGAALALLPFIYAWRRFPRAGGAALAGAYALYLVRIVVER